MFKLDITFLKLLCVFVVDKYASKLLQISPQQAQMPALNFRFLVIVLRFCILRPLAHIQNHDNQHWKESEKLTLITGLSRLLYPESSSLTSWPSVRIGSDLGTSSSCHQCPFVLSRLIWGRPYQSAIRKWKS